MSSAFVLPPSPALNNCQLCSAYHPSPSKFRTIMNSGAVKDRLEIIQVCESFTKGMSAHLELNIENKAHETQLVHFACFVLATMMSQRPLRVAFTGQARYALRCSVMSSSSDTAIKSISPRSSMELHSGSVLATYSFRTIPSIQAFMDFKAQVVMSISENGKTLRLDFHTKLVRSKSTPFLSRE
jgi:hypothetical protein